MRYIDYIHSDEFNDVNRDIAVKNFKEKFPGNYQIVRFDKLVNGRWERRVSIDFPTPEDKMLFILTNC